MWTMLGRMQEQWNISYRLPAVRNAEGGIIGDASEMLCAEVPWRLPEEMPEQAPNWDFIHRQVVTWARHNMEISSLVACAFGSAGRRTSGELVLRDDFGRILPLSVCTRLER